MLTPVRAPSQLPAASKGIAVTKAETLSLAESDCPTALAVIDDLTHQRGICVLAAKRVIKIREFFLRNCHIYKN